ncbi:MAG TPA: hypothetical protein VF981_06970 [Gemmatimonadaceae bacterium]
MLFSDRSLWTMLHGLVLSGGALVLLVTALFSLRAMAAPQGATVPARQSTAFTWLTVATAALLWAAVLGGTYIVFPMYRATPPDGIASLAAYPRALLMSSPDTRWLHAFGMEVKEHVPWIAAMLATAAAFVARRHRTTLLADASLRQITGSLLGISAVLVAFVALLGTFVNKVAPLW